jgi:hypothetical protein
LGSGRVEGERGFLELFGGDEVLESIADTFEEGDVVGAGADGFPGFGQFMQIGEQVVALNDTGLEGDQEVSGLGEGTVVGVDDDAGATDGDVIQFAGGGLETADGVDVSALAEHVAIEERSLGGGAGTKDVGFVGAGAGVDGFDFHAEFVLHLLGEVPGAGGILSTDEGAFEVADVAEDLQVSAGLASSAEDTEHSGVFAGEKLGRDRGGGGGPDVGEVVRRDDQLGATSIGIEQDVGGLDTVVGQAGALVELDELHAEAAADAVVTGHDEENAVGELHLGAGGHDGGGIAGAEGFLDRRNECARIEQAVNLNFGQNVHGFPPKNILAEVPGFRDMPGD